MTQALPSDVFEPTKTKLGSTCRKHMGLSAASKKDSIRQLAKQHGISRNTVRKARDKTLDALDKAFEPDQEAVDFNLPVTKKWIETLVLRARFKLGFHPLIIKLGYKWPSETLLCADDFQ